MFMLKDDNLWPVMSIGVYIPHDRSIDRYEAEIVVISILLFHCTNIQ